LERGLTERCLNSVLPEHLVQTNALLLRTNDELHSESDQKSLYPHEQISCAQNAPDWPRACALLCLISCSVLYCQVKLGTHLLTNESVAIKIFEKSKLTEQVHRLT
jgi:hypothetical protein